MKRTIPAWGLVTAAPNEFLVQIRRGEVVTAAQGGSCWKWPADTVALIDTSVRRLQFTADQVTREKTGVAVTGLAVFRVVDPLVAWRMLDLQREDALADILREMFVGATRRLVANLSLEECMTRRKEALATELMAEIGPVVSGRGRPEDRAEGGWGVVIDTIEVQDVRVLSQEVFERLQAPYREALQLQALHAEQERLEAERARAVAQSEHQAALERKKLQEDIARAEAKSLAALKDADRRARAEIAGEELRAQTRVKTAELEAAAERTLRQARAELTRLERAAVDGVSEARLREIFVAETLPQVAASLRGAFGEITVAPGDLAALGQGVAQVVGAVQEALARRPQT